MSSIRPQPSLLNNAKLCSLNKLRQTEPQLFNEICLMHLSQTIDLAGDDFKSLYEETTQSCTPPKSKKIKCSLRRNVMSGAPLTQEGICRIYQLVEYIAQDLNICQKLIFRKAGNPSRQFNLRCILNNGTALDLNTDVYNVHDCCCVLKGFLSELQEPLLSNIFFKVYLKVIEGYAGKEMKPKQLKCLRILLLLLPLENYALTYNVLTLLNKVSALSNVNDMDATNLAIIFSPILLCPKDLEQEELKSVLSQCILILSLMIENFEQLFEVPADLLCDIIKHIKDLESGRLNRSSPLPVNVTFCKRQPLESSKSYTEQKVEELFTDVSNMPDCYPEKKIFNKRVQSMKKKEKPIVVTPKRQKRTRTQSVGSAIMKLLPLNSRKKLDRKSVSCEKISKLKEGSSSFFSPTSSSKKYNFNCLKNISLAL